MTERPFSPPYAQAYDAFYLDKDYEGECDILERVIAAHAAGPTTTILDLGCGTAGHAIPLSARGYRVTGVDASAPMLRVARNKILRSGLTPVDRPVLIEGDLRRLALGRWFDAALMMFAVLGYQDGDAGVLAGLRSAARHLRPDGLLIGDVWYGPAVLKVQPSQRLKLARLPHALLIRTADPRLDRRRRHCLVRYLVWRVVGDEPGLETDELHAVRYFFPRELRQLLSRAGLHLAGLYPFPEIDQPLTDSTWNVLFCARAGAGPAEACPSRG